jgi:hypothetical protein
MNARAPKRERQIYRETYKRGALDIPVEKVTISSLLPGAKIKRVEIHARGFLESDDSPTGQLEFYELRVVIVPPA